MEQQTTDERLASIERKLDQLLASREKETADTIRLTVNAVVNTLFGEVPANYYRMQSATIELLATPGRDSALPASTRLVQPNPSSATVCGCSVSRDSGGAIRCPTSTG